MRKSKNPLKFILFSAIMVLPGLAPAAVPNTFSPGGQALASEVNDNFSDLDTRVTTLEGSTPVAPDFSGYGVSFSADGAPKNVVVSSEVQSDGSTTYAIRSRYANSSEQISIDGVLTTRPYIANYAFVTTDSGGNLVLISNFIEAPDTTNYVVYNTEESTYDVNTLIKTVDVDINRETFTCEGSVVLVCIGYGRLSANDAFSYIYDSSSNRVLSGPFSINGFTFNEVRMESSTGIQNRFRIRAKGIGEIFRRSRNSDGSISTRSVIYYQADGVSGGSLVGTPFDSGQPLDGLFF